jgi:hypothetical protein
MPSIVGIEAESRGASFWEHRITGLLVLLFLAGWLPVLAAPIEVVSGKNQTFRAGLTYLVGRPIRLEGSVRFEGGCVIKFLPSLTNQA